MQKVQAAAAALPPESPIPPGTKLALQFSGALCCLLLFLFAFVQILSISVTYTDSSDAPSWARNWLWASTAYRLDVVLEAARPPPPPPDF